MLHRECVDSVPLVGYIFPCTCRALQCHLLRYNRCCQLWKCRDAFLPHHVLRSWNTRVNHKCDYGRITASQAPILPGMQLRQQKKKLCCPGTNKTDLVPANRTGPTWSRTRTRKQNPGACLPVGTREWELSVWPNQRVKACTSRLHLKSTNASQLLQSRKSMQLGTGL